MASLVRKVAILSLLRFPPNGLPLYKMHGSRCALFYWAALAAELADVHSRRPVHSWSKPYKSRMREVDGDLLRIADECACSVTKTPSKIKHCSAGLRVFKASMSRKGEATGSYYGTLVYDDLSSRVHRKKLYGMES